MAIGDPKNQQEFTAWARTWRRTSPARWKKEPFFENGVLPNQGDFGRIFWDFSDQQKLREFFSRLKPGDVTLTHRDLTSKKSMEAVMPEDQGNAI